VRFFPDDLSGHLRWNEVPQEAVYMDHNCATVERFLWESLETPPPRFQMIVSALDTYGEIKKSSAQIDREIVSRVLAAADEGKMIEVPNLKIEIVPIIYCHKSDEIQDPKSLGLDQFGRIAALFNGLARYGIYFTIGARF